MVIESIGVPSASLRNLGIAINSVFAGMSKGAECIGAALSAGRDARLDRKAIGLTEPLGLLDRVE